MDGDDGRCAGFQRADADLARIGRDVVDGSALVQLVADEPVPGVEQEQAELLHRPVSGHGAAVFDDAVVAAEHGQEPVGQRGAGEADAERLGGLDGGGGGLAEAGNGEQPGGRGGERPGGGAEAFQQDEGERGGAFRVVRFDQQAEQFGVVEGSGAGFEQAGAEGANGSGRLGRGRRTGIGVAVVERQGDDARFGVGVRHGGGSTGLGGNGCARGLRGRGGLPGIVSGHAAPLPAGPFRCGAGHGRQRKMAVNPVPYQWIDADLNHLPPGTPNAEVDYGHPGVCSSLMAYCRDRSAVQDPAEIDFAWLDDIGYDILDAETAGMPEIYSYGAWATHAAWGAGVERVVGGDDDRLRAAAHAFGREPATALADSTEISGTAIWSGSLIGVDIRHAALPPVLGNAELEIDLATLDGAARFDNLASMRNGTNVPFRAPSLEYLGSVAGNRFADPNGVVSASFFGPAHEEMAGVVDDREVGLVGGFGGKR